MQTRIHAAGPTGQRSPGLDAAIAAWHAENPDTGGGGADTVFYGFDADTARPVSDRPVIWIGDSSVVPANAIDDFDLVVSFDVPPPPPPAPPDSAPTLVVAAYSDTRIDGTITPLDDATGYEWTFEAGTKTGDPTTGTPVDLAAVTTFSATGLTQATTYTFWARGYNDDGDGPWSAPQVGTTAAGLLTFTEDFETLPPSGRLTNDPDFNAFISNWMTVTTGNPTYGGYATGGSAEIIGNIVDPAVHAFPADQWAEIDVATMGSPATDARGIVYVRADGVDATARGYAASWNRDGLWRLGRLDDNVSTVLASGTITLALPHTLRIEAEGTTITFSIDGTEIASVTDATYTTGQPALAAYRSTVFITEFRAGAL